MACPPQVPISIIPPVSQGPSPLLWQNGNQITRLNKPLNPSFFVYDGSTSLWADGSAQFPIKLPNLQELTIPSFSYLLGVNSSGVIGKTNTTFYVVQNLAGGAAGYVPYQSAPNTTTFLPAGNAGQVLQSTGSAIAWVNKDTLLTAGSISGGSAGKLLYQFTTDTTQFVPTGTTGQILSANGTSAPSWLNQSAITAGNFSGSLSGDVTGNQTSTNVAFVGGQTASAVANATVKVGNASSSDVVSTIVQRDSAGNFAATTITANLTGNASSATTAVTSTNLSGGTVGQIAYQYAPSSTSFLPSGTAGQLLQSNGAAAPSWLSTSAISVNSANNIVDGTAGVVPYQVATGTTGFTAVGSTGQPLLSGGTGTPTWGTLGVSYGGTGVTSSSGANSVVLRDANANISANTIYQGFSQLIASSTTKVLTVSSIPNWYVTGSGGQVFQLPSALTLPNGATFTFNNNQSSGVITLNNNSGTSIISGGIPSGGYVTLVLLSNTLASGTWDYHFSSPANVSWSTNTFNYTGSITGATWNGNVVTPLYGGTGVNTLTGIAYGNGTSAFTAATGSQIATAIGTTAVTNATNATNQTGGSAGQVHYQTGSGTSGFTATGTSGQALLSGGSGSPTWSSAPIAKAYANISATAVVSNSFGSVTASVASNIFTVTSSALTTSSIVVVTQQGPTTGGYAPVVTLGSGSCTVRLFSGTTLTALAFSILVF